MTSVTLSKIPQQLRTIRSINKNDTLQVILFNEKVLKFCNMKHRPN